MVLRPPSKGTDDVQVPFRKEEESTRMNPILFLVVSLAAAPLTFEKLPESVRAKVQSRYPGAKVTGVEVEKDEGKVVYEIKFTLAGAEIEVSVAPDGKVVSEERKVALKDLPQAVQKAFASSAEKALKVERVDEVTEGGVKTWEIAGLRADGKRVEVVIDAQGVVEVHPATE